MSDLNTQIATILYDIKDELKTNLIELNQTRDLFMNGPSEELLSRALDIAYYQGQKQMIDQLEIELSNVKDNASLTSYLTNLKSTYQHQVKDNLSLSKSLANDLTHQYHIRGQLEILNQLSHLY